MADTGDALVVAFLGTKRAADHLVNLSLRHAPVFGKAGSAANNSSTAGQAPGPGPAARSGYLRRAAGIPVEQLYRLARVQGKRLVLAGVCTNGLGWSGWAWLGCWLLSYLALAGQPPSWLSWAGWLAELAGAGMRLLQADSSWFATN